MHVSLNKKQKIAIVVIIITMSIIAILLSKLINHEEPKTVTKTPEETVTEDLPPKETSTPEPTKKKEIPEAHEGKKSFSDYVESYILSNAEIKEIELEVGEPIQEIKSEEDIFETWGKFAEGRPLSFTVRINAVNETIWGMGSGGKINSEKIIRDDKEGFNIEGMNKALKDKGISIADCDIMFINNGLSFDNDGLVLKIFDSKKETNFLMKEKKLIDLSDYGITFFYNRVYSVKENKKNYVSMYNKKNNTVDNYIIPFEFTSVDRVYVSNKNPNEVCIVGKKNGEENLSYYKIKINDKTIVQFNTIKSISDFYPLKFSINSDVLYNEIIEEIGDLYLVDAIVEEYRDNENDLLYGLNKNTGKIIWSINWNRNSTRYFIGKDKKYLVLLNTHIDHVIIVEIQTGRVLWDEKFLKDNKSLYLKDSLYEFGNAFIVEYNKKLIAVNKGNWKKIWEIEAHENYDSRLIYEFSEDERYLYYFDENNFKAKCMEINTGKIIWEREIDSSSNIDTPLTSEIFANKLFIIFSENGVIAFNSTNGSIAWENQIEKVSGSQYRAYDIYRENVSIHNDVYILMYRDALIAINADDGEFVWERPLSKTLNYYEIYKKQSKGKEILVLLDYAEMYIFDSDTGEIISEVIEEGIGNYIDEIELVDNILYLYASYSQTDDIIINIETGEINHVPNTNAQEEIGNLEEVITGKILYDGIGISCNNYNNHDYIEARDKNGDLKWSNDFKNRVLKFNRFSPTRINNKLYINIEGIIVCVDALTGKKLYQLGVYDYFNNEIVELSDGIYWALRNEEKFDVYKIE